MWCAFSWGRRKGEARAFPGDHQPSSPTPASFLQGLWAGGVDGGVGALCWSWMYPHSFKGKSQIEFSLFPPAPTSGAGGWGARRDAGGVCRGTSAEQMCSRALQQLISIDLFWRQLRVFRQEVLPSGRRAMAWVGGLQPGKWSCLAEEGRPFGPGLGPACQPPGQLVHALPAR